MLVVRSACTNVYSLSLCASHSTLRISVAAAVAGSATAEAELRMGWGLWHALHILCMLQHAARLSLIHTLRVDIVTTQRHRAGLHI